MSIRIIGISLLLLACGCSKLKITCKDGSSIEADNFDHIDNEVFKACQK